MAKVDPRVVAAIRFAVDAHGTQPRKDGRTPYVAHPVGVLRRLSAELEVTDPTLLAAAVLHDVLEDTRVTPAELEGAFGARVLGLVQELTLPAEVHGPSVPTEEKTRHLVGDLERMSWESVLIKLCDRWDNLGDVPVAPWTREKTAGFLDQSAQMLEAVRRRRAAAPEPSALTRALERGMAGVERALHTARTWHADRG